MLVVMNDPAIAKQFRRSAVHRDGAAEGEKFGELIKADTEKWRKVVTEANIKLGVMGSDPASTPEISAMRAAMPAPQAGNAAYITA